MDKEV
jgi:hypothetical protein